jgi:hypothetical protein
MRVSQLFKILIFTLSILLLMNVALWSKGKEIVLEDYWYYVTHPDGKKVSIVSARTGGEPHVEVIFSPDSNYVAYTGSNGTGFEGEGRDLFYCKTDGSEKTLILSSNTSIRYLYWVKAAHKNYILFDQWGSQEELGHVRVYDFVKHFVVFDTLGTSLVRIGDTAKFLVSNYIFSWSIVYILDLNKEIPRTYGFEATGEFGLDSGRTNCAYSTIKRAAPELRVAPVGFIPPYWPHDSYNVSDYIDLVRKAFEFTRLTCLVPSPSVRFLAFSATGERFTCNGILDTKTQKTHALRFFLGTFDGQPCWSPNSEYVAFINLVDSRNKFINVFSIDSVLNSKYPMITKKEFERPTAKSFKVCFSANSDTLYYEVPGGFRDESGQIIIRR